MIFTISGTQVTAEFKEPESNANGTPLTDLKQTTLYYQLQGGPVVTAAVIPASTPAGGQSVVRDLLIPVLEGQESRVEFWATATDDDGNESGKTEIVVKIIDRLAPMPPS